MSRGKTKPEDFSKDTSGFRIVRRDFIKAAAGAGGIWVIQRALPGIAAALAPPADSGQGWSDGPGKARYRIDGVAKVTGQKVYARDFHSRDLKGWPQSESCAYIVRAKVANRALQSVNLDVLPPQLQPAQVVTGAVLARDQIIFPGSDESSDGQVHGLVVSVGSLTEFLGQPAAILVFENFDVFREAHRVLEFNDKVLSFGPIVLGAPVVPVSGVSSSFPPSTFKRPPLPAGERHPMPTPVAAGPAPAGVPQGSPYYAPPTYLTRYADATGERFSQVLDGITNPYSARTQKDREAAEWRQTIAEEIQTQGWQVFKGTYDTQELDPMFMEPESGLAWFDRDSATLHLVLGTQSTDESISDAVGMFSNPNCPIKVKTVVLNTCYPGGGFGGRDLSTFPTLLAIAAVYAQGPVRMAYDRFEQFQSGLKQLGASMTQTLAIDKAGRFQASVGSYQLQAGGLNNYSQWIAQLAGYCGGGGYAIPRFAMDAVANSSVGVIAGSMRGFGGPQAAFAVESLVDEAAQRLGIDPILLRENNALARGGFTVTGYQVTQSLRIAEICRLAREHTLWAGRTRIRQTYAGSDALYGVGFALANQAYGTGSDGTLAAVEIDRGGNVRVTTNCVDMGNGSATSLAISTARWLGTNAAGINMGDPATFASLDLNPYADPPDWSNPRWTPVFSLSSSACLTAFQQVHAVEQASRALFEIGLWPAACILWKLPDHEPYDPARAQWKNGKLVSSKPGLPPLSFAQLAEELYRRRQTAAAMVHAVYQGQWVEASYSAEGVDWRGPIDGLATRPAGGANWTSHKRSDVSPPQAASFNYGRSLFTPSGALAAVEVSRATGEVKVVAVQGFLEAGRVIQPDMVLGQFYGGVAMGIGFTLLEYLPHTQGGAGEGTWNLNRYHVPLWGDMPIDRVDLHLLEPSTTDEPGRGIAEAVLCPIAPAIANAIADATGHRFRTLPITAETIREALQA